MAKTLPILGTPSIERSDAARNRSRILIEAERLFAERGVDKVSMDDIAEAARVGKGTLYRRFGDKGGLGIAVLDARERNLQDALLNGPPPLGPGAPPIERLHAFADAYLDYLHRNLDLVVMCETASPGARYRSGVYVGWHQYLAIQLGSAGLQHPDTLADYLLSPLDGDLQRHLISQDTAPSELRTVLHDLIDRVVGT